MTIHNHQLQEFYWKTIWNWTSNSLEMIFFIISYQNMWIFNRICAHFYWAENKLNESSWNSIKIAVCFIRSSAMLLWFSLATFLRRAVRISAFSLFQVPLFSCHLNTVCSSAFSATHFENGGKRIPLATRIGSNVERWNLTQV